MTKIDFVILWVDNDDSLWKDEYQEYSLIEQGDKSILRFRDWDNLHYWFRGIERYASWVNNIFFITSGHIPKWLNTYSPNLIIIKHSDFIPIEYLPTFNSTTIELFLHEIDNLSEHFVYFNDDFFIINYIKADRFFKNGLPCDISAFNVYHGDGLSLNNLKSINLINRNFNQRRILFKSFFKLFSFKNKKLLIRTILLSFWPYFVGFYDHHLPQPFLKSCFKEVWKNEHNLISQSISRFRKVTNFTQYLIRYWQLVSGKFQPYDVFKDSIYFSLNNNNLIDAVEIIRNQTKSIIILNDTDETDFEKSKELINQSFKTIFPIKSKYEL